MNMNERKIKILSAPSHIEFVERLKNVLGEDNITEDAFCDCAIALLDGYESVNTTVAAKVLETIGRGITVIPIDVTKEPSALSDVISQIANPASLPSLCESCVSALDSGETAANEADADVSNEESETDECCEECDCCHEPEAESSDATMPSDEVAPVEEIAFSENIASVEETAPIGEAEPVTVDEPIIMGETELPTHDEGVDSAEQSFENAVPHFDESFAASAPDTDSNVTCECGAKVDSDMLFCWNCGRKMTKPEPEPETAQNKCSCGADIIPGTAFCWNCGKHIDGDDADIPPAETVAHCPTCGAVTAEEDNFCFSCGQRL